MASPPREYYELRKVLISAADNELKKLRDELRWPTVRPVWPRLTRTAVRLGIGLVEERTQFVDKALEAGAGENAWRADPDYLTKRIREVAGVAGLRWWSEHYNAACIYAIPLLVEERSDDEEDAATRRRLAALAVRRLERATVLAGSAVIAGRRQWLLSEDPDLDGLRKEPAFKRFEVSFLPSPTRAPTRPRGVHRLEMSRYTQELIAATARSWEQEWHRRGRQLQRRPDIHDVLAWWSDEAQAWRLVRRAAANRRHWGARVALLQAMDRWSEDYGFAPLHVSLADYTDEIAAGGDVDKLARDEIAALNERMNTLAGVLDEAAPIKKDASSLVSEVTQLQNELRSCDGEALRVARRLVAQLCDAHASLWQRLREWLEDPEADHGNFQQALARTERVWEKALWRWPKSRIVHEKLQHPSDLRPDRLVRDLWTTVRQRDTNGRGPTTTQMTTPVSGGRQDA